MKQMISFVSVGAILAIILAACGPSTAEKAEKAKQEARQQALAAFQSLRVNNLSGPAAEVKEAEILSPLNRTGQDLKAISVGQFEIEGLVQDGWARDAKATLIQFGDTKADPQRAQKLLAQFKDELQKSHRTMAMLGTSDAKLNQVVAMNALEVARASRATITPAMYKAAGIPTNNHTIVKRLPAKPVRHTARKAPAKRHNTKPAERRGGD